MSERERGLRLTRRGRVVFGGLGGALVLLVSYLLVFALLPLPTLTPRLTPQASAHEVTFPTDDLQRAVDAGPGAAGLAWVANGKLSHGRWVSNNAKRPIASITKVVTALVGLEHSPIGEHTPNGPDGRTFTLTERDAKIVGEFIAQDGVTRPARPGMRVTERQMLELMLLASANNYAVSYAEHVFGSQQKWAAATADWLRAHGLTRTTIVEPSGIDDRNASTPEDLLRLGALAMNQPVVVDTVAKSHAEVPGIGRITNLNRFVTNGHGIGIKTGTTDVAGANVLAAAKQTAGSRKLTLVAVVLGVERGSGVRFKRAAELTAATRPHLAARELVAARAEVGSVTTWDGRRVGLRAAREQPLRRVVLPGERARIHPRFDRLGSGVDRAGTRVGELTVTTATGAARVPVVTTAAIRDPGPVWRWSHPLAVLGMTQPKPEKGSPQPKPAT